MKMRSPFKETTKLKGLYTIVHHALCSSLGKVYAKVAELVLNLSYLVMFITLQMCLSASPVFECIQLGIGIG